MPADWNPGTQWVQAFTAGSNAANESFANGLRMQQLRSQQAMQRLEEQKLAQELQFQMEAHGQMVQQRANNEKARAAFMVTQTPFLPGPNGALPNPAYQPDAGKAYLQSMMPYTTDPTATVLNAAKIQLEQAQAQRALREQQFQPRIVDVPVGDGETIKFGFTSPNSGQWMNTGEPEVMEQGGQKFVRGGPNDKWRPDTQGAIRDRMSATAQNRLAEKAPDLSIPNPAAPGMRQIPEQNFNQFAARESMTTGTRSNLEQQGNNAERMVANGQKLLALINEQNLGVPGQLKRVAEAAGLTTFFPSLADPDIAALTATGRAFTANVIKGLRSDGNINKDEVSALEDASNTYKWTDPVSAKARIKVFLEQARDVARDSYKKLGKPAPPQYMTFSDLQKLRDAGTITDEQAFQMYQTTVDWLIQQVQNDLNRQQ